MNKSDRIRACVSIFTMCTSIAGVVSTAIFAVKSTPKAEELLKELKQENPEPTTVETIKKVAPVYLPAAISGILTISCIIATTVLNKKSQVSLAGTYALLNHNFQKYRGTVNKLFGDDADQKVMDDIIKSECNERPLYSPGLVSCTTLDFDVDEEKHLFYDSYSCRYFESTIGNVLQAEYHLNRNYILKNYATINDFYSFLGLDHISDGDVNGWNTDSGLEWIDFDHRRVKLEEDGNLECLVISFPFPPWADEEDYMSRR